jgi:hypothetical protein
VTAPKIPPLCRYCGAPIRKRTHTVYFGRAHDRLDDYLTERTERPTSKEEAQRLLNHQIVSVRWTHGDRAAWSAKVDYDYICQVTTWDGERYVDPYFCNGEHARRFAYLFAKNGSATVDYTDARQKLLAKFGEFDQSRVQRKAK